MAAFYGMVRGNRGDASRTGTKDSGIEVSAQSWDGSLSVWLRYDADGDLVCNLYAAEDSSPNGDRIFSGTLDELRERLARS